MMRRGAYQHGEAAGTLPALAAGTNEMAFSGENDAANPIRARVTVISEGDPLKNEMLQEQKMRSKHRQNRHNRGYRAWSPYVSLRGWPPFNAMAAR